MPRVYHLVVGSGEAGLRLDHYLVRRLPTTVSRSAIQRVVREGGVTIHEAPVKANRRLRAGDVVLARFDQLPAAPTKLAMTPQDIPLEVVYEDAHVLVVNKPAGLVTHPAPGHWDGTLVNGLLWHFGQQQSAGNAQHPLPRAGIIHRLDKDTSGLLLVAKTDLAHAALAKQMKVRAIKRQYLALVEGHVPLSSGTVDAAIARHTVHRKEMTVRHLGGRSAVTHYRVLKRFGAQSRRIKGSSELGMRNAESISNSELRIPNSLSCTLLEVSLETGRTHQIRVHMAHLGYPVAGDTTYGKHPAGFWQALGIHRQLLHAFRLTFRHPAGGRVVTMTAPIPDDMMPWIDPGVAERLATLEILNGSTTHQRGRGTS